MESPYWADPSNQAVMEAWTSGIVVVAAAGNYGSAAGTAPGNVPYIVTVGAIKKSVYSPWKQGAGLVDITAAFAATPTEPANAGMDVNLDLTADTHYWGHTDWDEASQTFCVADSLTGELQAT